MRASVLLQAAQASDDEGGEDEEEGTDGNGNGNGSVDTMTYDQLLALSDRIGDVAKERWALKSAVFIASLPKFTFTGEGACAAAGGLGDCCDRLAHLCALGCALVAAHTPANMQAHTTGTRTVTKPLTHT